MHKTLYSHPRELYAGGKHVEESGTTMQVRLPVVEPDMQSKRATNHVL